MRMGPNPETGLKVRPHRFSLVEADDLVAALLDVVLVHAEQLVPGVRPARQRDLELAGR